MEEANSFEFLVDEKYENEKGTFTVLSIHKNEMVIRWESGEERRTDIELQRNIQARRQWEVEQFEKEANAAMQKKRASQKKDAFEGFKESDFKDRASGTKWRGRNQLGGAVTQKLPEGKYKFNSWAFANKPELHWLDTAHYKRKSGESRARFFARVDTESLFCGFSIGQPATDGDSSRNWENFMDWSGQENNAEALHTRALSLGLTIQDNSDFGSTPLIPVKDGWQLGDEEKKHAIGKLAELIGKMAAGGGLTLEVARRLEKKEVMAAGKDIAKVIAELFSQLMPLYEGALTNAQ